MKKLIASIMLIVGLFFSAAAMACPDCSCGDDCKCKPCDCEKK